MTAEEKRLRALLADAMQAIRDGCDGDLMEWDYHLPLLRRIESALERSEASKRGKSNRARGHSSELLVVDYLKSVGFEDATTTRNTGGEGGKQSGDVSFAPGAVLEVKYEQTPRYPAWCRQAAQEAGVGRVPVVVRRVKGTPDVGLWPAVVPRKWWLENCPADAWPAWVAKLRGDFSAYQTGGGFVAVGDDTYVVTRFWRVAEAFRLDQ